MDDRVCLGAIVGAHGVRGLVRVKSFTENIDDIAAYGPLEDDDGNHLVLEPMGRSGRGLLLVRVEGVNDRDAAEALKGRMLHVARTALPPTGEDEYYHADLIGVSVYRTNGSMLGTIVAMHDFGAGDLMDVRLANSGRSVLLPFNRSTAPVVDLVTGRIVVELMPGLLDDVPAAACRDGADD